VYDGNTVLRTQETVWAASDIDPSGLGATAGYAAQTRSTNSFDNPQITYRTDTVHDLYGNAVSEYARAYQVGASQTVTNAGFESGITGWVSFWSPYPSGSVTSDAAHSGTYSLKLANADHYGGAFQDIGNLTEGRAYTIRAWTKAEVEMTSRLQLWVHDTDATTVGDEKQGSWYAPPTEWQQIETTYVAPSNGNLRLHFFLSPGDGAVYIDDVTITEEEADNAARSVHREYLSHTDEAWFVGLPSHEAVFDGICEPDEINVLFTNDLKNASGDRNLYVDYVEVDGKVIQAEGGRMVVDKYATVTASYFDGADVLPGQEIIAWNAALRTRTTGPWNAALRTRTTGPYSTGSPQIVIRAKGTPADSVYPSMQVRVNGAVITTTTVTANWQTYTVTASLGNCGQAASRSFTYYDDTSGDIDAWGESEDIDTGTVTMQAQGLLGVSGEPTATTRLGYDAWGNTVVITDALGHVVTTTYDSSYHQYPVATCAAVGTADELCTETEYYGVNETATTGDYGLFGQVQRTIDANDQAMHYVYDAFGTSVRVKYPDDAGFGDGQVSERTSYHFEGTIGQQRYIARQGRDATWQEVYYDGLGRVIQAHQYAEAGQEIRTTTGYDALGRAVRQWTPTYGTHSEDGGYGSYGYVPASPALPQTITFYDTLGQTSRDPDGGTANAFQIGSRSIAVDANGHRRDSIADGLRRVVEVIEYPNDPEVIEGEDTLEYCTGEIDIGSVRLSPSAGTGVCWMSYGPYETPEEEGPGQVVRFRLAIDSLSGGDDLIATIDVNDYTAGHVSLASRDLYRSDFVGGLWNFTDFALVFDTTGRGSNQLEYRVKWQNTARLSHDRTELIWTSDPITTTYAYDTLDNLTVVTDTLGNATRMTYDGLGRKVEMVDPDMGRWTYAYDAGGNLVTQIDAKLQATDFYYNARNELTGKAYALGVNPAGYTRPGTPTTYAAQYGYDESGHGESLGRRTTMTDTSGSTSWTYDTRGRVTQEVKVIDTETFTTTMTYNSLDQVVTTTYPDGEVVTNTYNAATQPVSLTSSLDDYVTGATYEATGALADLVLGNGLTTTYSYDPRTARLTGLRTGELLKLHYMYDRVGNVRSLYDVTEDEIQTFDYDALDRLTAAHYGDYDAEIADGFGSSTLGNDWEAYVPVSEPTYSLTARSGYLRLSATSGTPYDHWTAADSALQIRTVGSMTETIAGDWSLETKLDLTTYTTDQPFQTGLMVYFGQYDIAYWGPHGGTRLRLERSGEAGILQVDNTATTVWLRVRKVGTSYVFEYETSANGDWVTAGQAEWGGIPERVGVILKTWGTTGATTTADFDYVNLAGIGDDTMRSYTYDAVGNLTSKTGAGVYTYTTSLGLTGCMTGTPTTKPHAVRETGSYGPFGYDCNGNMTERTMGSDTYALTYSVENKLVTATTGVTTTSYLYDGDGVLVMKTDPDGVTRYVGEHYEELSTTAGDTTIGEVGQLTVTDTHQVVPLSRSYTDPVVFVQPASYNESDPTVARLVSVQGDRFTVKLQDAPNKTQTHAAESVSYLVFEAGAWDLPGGGMIEVGALDTSATQGASPASWTTVSFSDTFASTPVILSQVQTYSDTHWVKTRQTSASTSGFSVALEEDEAQTSPHGAETVGWLAITAGSGTWNGHAYMAGQTGNSVNGNWYSLSLSGFTAAPRFLASLATQRSSDSAHVRYQSLTSTNVQVKAEEDTTADGETGHTPEAVAYLAIQGDGTLTAATGGASTTTVTKYYYLGGQRVAMRVATETTWIHGDHLGSASLTTDDTGSSVGQMRYYPYGETRGTGSVATDRRYTGQREDYYTQLVQMGVRWYDADLARWTSPDSIVPAPANPQSLNRYTYVYGNPLAYTDPDGHFPWLIVGGVALLGSVATRLGSEYLGSRITGVDRARRDQVGGALVLDYSAVIEREAAAHSVDPVSVGAVLRFESAAVERRAFAAYPGSQPGLFSNGFEALQTVLPSEWSNEWMRFGDMASIGPGQMQLRRALELEEMGYVSRRGSTEERRSALLGRATSIEYVAGMLHYLADQLSAYPEYSALSGEGQQRLQLIAYNWGWTDSFESRLQELGLQGMIDWWGYDDSLLDGYGQWEAGQ